MIWALADGTEYTDCRESAEVDQVSGRLRTVTVDVNINTILRVIEDGCHSSIWKLADDLHIPRMLIQRILTMELGMKYISSMWVPHLLQIKEIECRHSVCLENLSRISYDPNFLSRAITVDESWIYHYNPKTKHESEAWLHSGKSRMKKVCQLKVAGKVMLVAFTCQGMVHQHVCPSKTWISKKYYKMVPERLIGHIWQKWSELLRRWILRQDNARP